MALEDRRNRNTQREKTRTTGESTTRLLIWLQQQSHPDSTSQIMRSMSSVTRSSAIAEGPRDASCQLKSCQLPHNSAETTYTTSPDQIDGMKLEI